MTRVVETSCEVFIQYLTEDTYMPLILLILPCFVRLGKFLAIESEVHVST